MSSIIRITFSIVFLCFAASGVLAQETKIATAEKASAEAERLEKIWWIGGNLQKIAENYEKALTIWRELSDKKREAETLLRLANANALLENRGGKSEKAKLLSAEALEIFKTLGDRDGEALALCYLAWQSGFESLEKSKLLFAESLALARQIKAEKTELIILYSLALTLSNNGDSEKALEMLDQALPLARKTGEIKRQANINFAYGLIFWRIGDYEKSLFHYEQAHKFFKESGDFSWATTSVENAALVYNLLEQPEKVIESYKEALPFRRETGRFTEVADNLTSMAAALVKLNQPEKALENLSEAMKIYEQSENKYGIAWAFRIYGEANFAFRKFEKAIEYFEKSRSLQSELNEANGAAKAIYWLAKTELERGNLKAALTRIEEVIALVENQLSSLNKQDLRLAFFSARRDYYELYIEILIKLNEDEKALEASEKSRAKNLFEALANKPNPKALSAKEIQNLLDADTALLEFSLGKRVSFLFVVAREKIQIFTLPKAVEIESLVQEIRFALSEAGRRNYAKFVTASRRLYEILLKNAEVDLKAKKNLLIAPDDSLNYLPFDVLLTAEPNRIGRADFQKLPYAVQNWAIHYTPSASVLAEITNQKPKTKNQKPKTDFVAFGDPIYGEIDVIASNRVRRFVNEVFNSATLPRLADSNREVTNIATNFGSSSRVFLRGEATEQNVKRTDEIGAARIIHFATHGIVHERQPQFSGLLLSQTSNLSEDGLLQTDEIYNLDLSADLVVLSACRTALGKNLRGEGVIGLTRAFLRAGSKSVAATLWQVEDISTADLMIDFYKNLKTAPDKSTALREAKLTMLKNPRFAHPHFWASFVLNGAK